MVYSSDNYKQNVITDITEISIRTDAGLTTADRAVMSSAVNRATWRSEDPGRHSDLTCTVHSLTKLTDLVCQRQGKDNSNITSRS